MRKALGIPIAVSCVLMGAWVEGSRATPSGASSPVGEPESGLAAAMRRAHFAFRRAADGALEGGHSTYGSRVSPDGLEMTMGEEGHQTAVALRTSRIRLGTATVQRHGRSETATRRGHATLTHAAGVVEELENQAAGVEQTWHLDQLAEGPLEIDVQVAGMDYVGRDTSGLVFADARTGMRLHYSDAVAVDAVGKRWNMPARFDNGQIHLSMTADDVAAATAPLVVDPTISPEYPAGTIVTYPVAGEETVPAIASDGNVALVAWRDNRYGAPTHAFATRLDGATAAVLDPDGIDLGTMMGTPGPAVAYGGGTFGIAYPSQTYGMAFSRVLQDGTVQPTLALTQPGPQAPTIAWNGTDFLVAWFYQSFVSGNRVSPQGIVKDGIGKQLGTFTANSPTAQFVSLASDGANWLLAWSAETVANGWQNHLNVLDGNLVTTASNNGSVRVSGTAAAAWDGLRWIVGGAGGAISIINPNLSLYKNVKLPGAMTSSTNVGVASNGQISMGVYQEGGYYAATVQQDGTVVVAPQPVAGSAVAWVQAGGAFFAAGPVITSSQFGNDIRCSRVKPDMTKLGANTLVSTRANTQTSAAAAFDGTNYLVAWQDDRSTISSTQLWYVFFSRVDAAGTVLNPDGIQVAAGSHPAVAYGAGQYFLAWEGAGGVWGTRVDVNGVSLDGLGSLVAKLPTGTYSGGYRPSVVWDGSNFVVAYSVRQDLPLPAQLHVYAARVAPDGARLDPNGFVVSSAAKSQDLVSLASSGAGETLAVWQDSRNSATTVEDIYAARIQSDGTVLDPTGIVVATAPNRQLAPRVAVGGGQYFVVWHDERAASGKFDIYGARISSAGDVLDAGGMVVSAAANNQTSASVAFTGANFLVGWDDLRNPKNIKAVYGARVSGAGSLLDAQGFLISSGTTDQSAPIMTAGAAPQVLAAYQVKLTTAQRLMLRYVADDGTCGTPADCPDDGLACTTTTCTGGTCGQSPNPGACVVGGTCFATGDKDPSDPCLVCDPATSQTAFTLVATCGSAGSAGSGGEAGASGAGGTGTGGVGGAAGSAGTGAAGASGGAGTAGAAGSLGGAGGGGTSGSGGVGASSGSAGAGGMAGGGGGGPAAGSGGTGPTAGNGGMGGAGGGGASGGSGGAGGAAGAGTSGAGQAGAGGAAGAAGMSKAGSAGTAMSKLCVPGDQKACACPGGLQGVQACKADGSAYEACQCGSPADPAEEASDDSSGGCGCATPRNGSRSGALAGLLLGAMIALRRARRGGVGRRRKRAA